MAGPQDVSHPRPVGEVPAYEALVTALGELTNQALVTTDSQGRVTRWSEAAEVLFGVPAPLLLGRPLSGIWGDAVLRQADEALAGARGHPVRGLPTAIPGADGRLLPVGLDVIELPAGGGSGPGRAYCARDRRAELKAETDLSVLGTQRALLSRAVSSSPLAVLGCDLAGVVTLAQGGALALGPSVLGTSVFELFRDRPVTLERLRQALQGSSVDDVTDFEGRILRAAYRPLRDDAGEVVGATLTGIDVTSEFLARDRSRRDTAARHLAEDAQVEAQEGYRGVVEGAPDAIAVLDREGRIAMANPRLADLLALSLDAVVGRRFSELGLPQPDDAEPVRPQPFQRADDPTRWLELSQTEVGPEPGLDAERVLWIRDVTGRIAMEDRLFRASRMEAVGAFAGGVVHDFNNVLSVIRGHAELLGESELPEGPARQDLEGVTEGVDRAVSLLQQLVAFARNQVMEPQLVSLNEQLSAYVEFLGPLVPEDVRLEVILASQPTPVFVDPAQLERVVTNLVLNARDALGGPGHVRLTTDVVDDPGSGPRVRLSVADDGNGMPPEVAMRCFEPFYTTKESGVGTGLGLATAYGIVEQSGGTIDVQSRIGQGTVFTVDLPRAEEGVLRREDPPGGD